MEPLTLLREEDFTIGPDMSSSFGVLLTQSSDHTACSDQFVLLVDCYMMETQIELSRTLMQRHK